MGLLFKRTMEKTIKANSVVMEDGVSTIDVLGQTCPGYLLAINQALEALPPGITARLLSSYPPCGDDLAAYCRLKGYEYAGVTPADGMWVIEVKKHA